MRPLKVNILGKKYTIKYVKNLSNSSGEILGSCHSDKSIIYINASHKNEIESTLLHELGHAICYEIGVYLTPSWSIDLEEIVVEKFSQVILDNFKLSKK